MYVCMYVRSLSILMSEYSWRTFRRCVGYVFIFSGWYIYFLSVVAVTTERMLLSAVGPHQGVVGVARLQQEKNLDTY